MKKLIIIFSLFYSSLILCSAPASTAQTQKKYNFKVFFSPIEVFTLSKPIELEGVPDIKTLQLQNLIIRLKNTKNNNYLEERFGFYETHEKIYVKCSGSSYCNSNISPAKKEKMKRMYAQAKEKYLNLPYSDSSDLQEFEFSQPFQELSFNFNRLDLPYEIKNSCLG